MNARRSSPPKADPKDNPGNDTVLRKEPCPECGSKDNLVRYADGHAHCFSSQCDHWEPAWEGGVERDAEAPANKPATGLLKPDDVGYNRLTKRKIEEATLRKMGHFSTGFKGSRVGVYNYYDQQGNLSFQKVKTNAKQFLTLKAETSPGDNLTKARPYGWHVWGDKHDKKVVIFTGEDDADAAAQVTKFKFPCVSVPTGDQGAAKHIKANYKWYDRFEEVILFFDNDESGQGIIEECASLFESGKVKVAKLDGFKDASAILQDNRPGDIEAAIWAAASWAPAGIVNARDGEEDFFKDGSLLASWPYPWPDLQAATRGQRRGEISLHIGGTGIAKTTLLFHYAQHLLRWDGTCPEGFSSETFKPEVHPVKVGWLGFEDTLKSLKTGLISMEMGQRIALKPPPEVQTRAAYKKLFGGGQLEIYDPETAEWGLEPAMAYIRFMVKALGCSIIVIDPLSFLVSMMSTRDRTQSEEQLAAKMAYMAKTLGCHIHISHHLKKADGTPFEEGGEVSLQDAKGAGAWYQYASNVFAYERDQQGLRPDLLRIRRLKVRLIGGTGVTTKLLKYDPETGRYDPTDDEWPDKDADKDSGGFGRVERPRSESDY